MANRKFPQGLLAFLNSFNQNRPNKAERDLRKAVRDAESGTEFLIHSPVSKDFEKELVKIAKRGSVKLTFVGQRYNYKQITPADKAYDKEMREKADRAREEWINSPG